SGERIALALRPLGGRFPQPPAGFADYAVEVPGQGDRFAPFAPVDPEEPALVVAGAEHTAADVVERARADASRLGLTGPGSRLLSGLAYDTWEGLSAGLYAPLASDGSVVLCRHLDRLDETALAQRIETERVTATAR
ncbi:TIGR03089 family protein, partial [Streptomyces sp. SID625]|nr:TIGR03089 family protein [Streptomyces sp. SID625]